MPRVVRLLLGTVAAASVVALVGADANDYWLRVLSTALNFACVSLAWGFLLGFAGQLHFAPAAIWGAGGYMAAIMATKLGWNPWVALVAGTAAATLLGTLLVLPALRLRRIYLGLFTLAFGEVLRLVMINEDRWTNGPSGLGLSNVVFGEPLNGSYGVLISTLTLLVFSYLALSTLKRSRYGLYLQALRDDQMAAEVRGINVALCKLWAFVVASAIMAAAGALFAYQSRFVSPELLHVDYSFQFIVMALFGGIGSFAGPIVGALSLTLLLDLLRAWEAWRWVILGALVCVNVLIFPFGIVGALDQYLYRRVVDRLVARRFGSEKHFEDGGETDSGGPPTSVPSGDRR